MKQFRNVMVNIVLIILCIAIIASASIAVYVKQFEIPRSEQIQRSIDSIANVNAQLDTAMMQLNDTIRMHNVKIDSLNRIEKDIRKRLSDIDYSGNQRMENIDDQSMQEDLNDIKKVIKNFTK